MRELNDKRGVHYGPATNPQIMPYLTELPNDRSPRGLWLLVIVSGNVPDPGEYDLSEDLEDKRHMMHAIPSPKMGTYKGFCSRVVVCHNDNPTFTRSPLWTF
jgi:hypothetical protein